ncbi:MAG TPA: copper amine oxidase N-terminal domain-containing protein [Ureibacillus sp.]|nr:copper amine oxidase N-terminal domain-containing protein [Ureibacillus sp.]
MKRILSICFALLLVSSLLSAYDSTIKIEIDGVVLKNDVDPELKNNRVMVPIRVISENLGVTVNWTDSVVILTKKNLNITFNLKQNTVTKNGTTVSLDMNPYIKNGRLMVPLRFISETFGSGVQYKNGTVSIQNEPLVINNQKVGALQSTTYMTMGSIVQQLKVNSYIKDFYTIFTENKVKATTAPESYSRRYETDIPGHYVTGGPFEFLDPNGQSIKTFEIYTLVETFPEEMIKGYPKTLLFDVTENRWYLLKAETEQLILELMDKAYTNGLLEVISNNVA